MRNLFLLLLVAILAPSILKFAWGSDSNSPAPLKSDSNLDSRVDARDLFTLLKEWRETRDQVAPDFSKDDPNASKLPAVAEADEQRLASEPVFTGFGPEVFVGREESSGEFTIRKRELNLDFARLAAARDSHVSTLRLDAFSDVALDARIVRRYIRTPDRYSLIGTVGEGLIGEFIITVRDGYVQGRIRTPDGRLYFFQGKNGQAVEVREVELTEGFVCHVGHENSWDRKAVAERKRRLTEEKIAKGTPSCPTPMYDDGSTFDILVVYTPWARCAAEGGDLGDRSTCLTEYPTQDGAILCGIDQAIDDLNAAFENSDIPVVANVVHAQEVGQDYLDEGAVGYDLNYAVNPSDSVMDEIPVIRDYYNADMAVLVICSQVAQGQAFGVADSMEELEEWAENAYCVVSHTTVVGESALLYVFQHELSHVMGCAHQYDPWGNGVFPYSFGYSFYSTLSSATFETIAQPTSEFTRINLFSNPDLTYAGEYMGVEDQNDNARGISETAEIISNWRSQIPQIISLNAGDDRIWSIDEAGHFVSEGDFVENANSGDLTASIYDLFIIRDESNDVVLRVDSVGDIFSSGSIAPWEECPLSPVDDIITVRTDVGESVSFIDLEGSFYLTGRSLIWNGGFE